jgi:hypothetical protein
MVDRVARFLEATSVSRETQTMDEISQRMGDGEGLPAICKGWDVPYSRMLSWLMADEKRYAAYERALEVAAHALVSEVVPLVDASDDTPKARVQMDARFRTAQFHAREKYGEKAQQAAVLPHVQINIGVRSGAGGAPAVTVEGEVDDGI